MLRSDLTMAKACQKGSAICNCLLRFVREFFKVHKNTRCSGIPKNVAIETAAKTVAVLCRHNLIMEALDKALSFIHNLFISRVGMGENGHRARRASWGVMGRQTIAK